MSCTSLELQEDAAATAFEGEHTDRGATHIGTTGDTTPGDGEKSAGISLSMGYEGSEAELMELLQEHMRCMLLIPGVLQIQFQQAMNLVQSSKSSL